MINRRLDERYVLHRSHMVKGDMVSDPGTSRFPEFGLVPTDLEVQRQPAVDPACAARVVSQSLRLLEAGFEDETDLATRCTTVFSYNLCLRCEMVNQE